MDVFSPGGCMDGQPGFPLPSDFNPLVWKFNHLHFGAQPYETTWLDGQHGQMPMINSVAETLDGGQTWSIVGT
jgi:hypothetical protein